MPLLALGINHKTAPVQIRERVAFGPERIGQALTELLGVGVREAAILSTCNRTELYCGLEETDARRVIAWLGRHHAMELAELEPYLYQHPDREAVRHILRVAAGLDSMVLGEPQILGQVKTAYRVAAAAGATGSLLNRLFQHAFAVAKQIRTDTRIGASPVSVAFAAVSLARQIFGDFRRQTALLIGAGETIELVARHLHENGIERLVIANRTIDRARELALPVGAYAIGLGEIRTHLPEADIVIACTASPRTLLERAHVEAAFRRRKHRPVLMVDIAVPRDIDPAVAELEDVYLYTVDDLQEIIQENLRSRQQAALQAEEIIDTEVEHFMAWLRSHNSFATIRDLRHRAEAVRDQALLRARRQLRAGRDPEEVLAALASTLTNKLIHTPSVGLREAGSEGRQDLVAAIRTLYKLDDGVARDP